MEWASALGLASIFFLVLANGFFVATEFAFVAVRRSRLNRLVQEGRAGATAARNVVSQLDTYIAATQFGITLASLALGWIGEPALADLLEPLFAGRLGGFAPAVAHAVAIGTAFALITGLHIILGELAPKGLALQRSERVALWVARPIQLFHALFKWPITALNAVGNATLRFLGLEPASGREMVHSVDELRLLVTSMEQAGVVDVAEARLAHRAFAFGDLTAGALMTPRTEMEGVPIAASLEDLLAIAGTTRFSRLPVYETSIDNVVGIFRVQELLRRGQASAETFSLRAVIETPLMVHETKYAADLLEEMRRSGCQVTIVLDEYGGTAGMVTLRDLLEALVGRISDVLLVEPPTRGGRLADGSVLLDGLMRIEEFEETTGLQIDEELHSGVETLGGLIPAVLGRFPDVGEEVTIAGRRMRIEGRDGLRVALVRLLPEP